MSPQERALIFLAAETIKDQATPLIYRFINGLLPVVSRQSVEGARKNERFNDDPYIV